MNVREWDRWQDSITRRQSQAWWDGVAAFGRGAGLRRWNPLRFPVSIDYFGHARHWQSGPRRGSLGPEICYLDHQAYWAIPGGRLAVIISWPYMTGDVVKAYVAEALPPPRFVTGVDEGCPREGAPRVRVPSSAYMADGITGWIVADADTLGAARAKEIVAAFLAGDHGLAEAAEAQRVLDAEWAELRTHPREAAP